MSTSLCSHGCGHQWQLVMGGCGPSDEGGGVMDGVVVGGGGDGDASWQLL